MKKFALTLLTAFSGTLGIAISSPVAFAATYEVPGQTPEQNPLLAMDSFHIQQTGTALEVRYKLPIILTGIETSIEMNGTVTTNNTAIVKGPMVDGVCELSKLQCNVAYHDLVIDETKIITKLQSMNLPQSEFDSLLSISRHFGEDPIGILHFESIQIEKNPARSY